MALGDERLPLMMRLRSRWELVQEIGALLAIGALALLLLMLLGLGVHELSTVVGTPLPYVDDDPDRIEWGGLAELVGYGLAGALAIFVLYALGQRTLPATARRHIGRWIGVAVLLAVAATGVWATIGDGDLRAAGLALACASGAYHVARGLPLVDDEEQRRRGGSPHDERLSPPPCPRASAGRHRDQRASAVRPTAVGSGTT